MNSDQIIADIGRAGLVLLQRQNDWLVRSTFEGLTAYGRTLPEALESLKGLMNAQDA